MEWTGGRFTDVFLTVSVSEAEDARRLGIFRDAVAVGNGRDPAVFRPDASARSAIRAALGRRGSRGGGRGLAAGARQGLSGTGRGDARVPEAELWVVGERLDSDRGDDMAALLAESGLGDRLRLLGYRDDVAAMLAAADIFVLPSYFEGLPMSVIEAMLVGLPVVATDIGGPREQVVPDVTGAVPPRQVAPLAAALARLAGGCRTARGDGPGGPRTRDRAVR